MTPRSLALSVCLAALVAAPACRKKQVDLPPGATPTIAFSSTRIPLGSPVEVTYKFQVAQGATFDDNYIVLVHFLDSDDELMWTDDHQPPVPTSTWKPGQTIEYKRTMFAPIYRYVGQASVHIGLYSPKTSKRLPLAGRVERPARIQGGDSAAAALRERVPAVQDGWHPAETAANNSAVEWQWTKKSATSPSGIRRSDIPYTQTIRERIEPQVVTEGQRPAESSDPRVTPHVEFVHKTP